MSEKVLAPYDDAQARGDATYSCPWMGWTAQSCSLFDLVEGTDLATSLEDRFPSLPSFVHVSTEPACTSHLSLQSQQPVPQTWMVRPRLPRSPPSPWTA